MGYIILTKRGKKSLNFKLFTHNFKKLLLEGVLRLKDGKIWNLITPRLTHALPRKDVMKLFREHTVVLPAEHIEAIGDVLKREKLPFKTVELCSICLTQGRIKPVRKNHYVYSGKKLCEECARAEIERELKFRGFSKSASEQLSRMLLKERDLEKAIKLLQSTTLREEHTLYDRIEGEVEEFMEVDELPINAEFKEILKERGIEKLNAVQTLAIKAGLLEDASLLVVSSTASGKTLIAELAGISAALHGRRFLYLVPLVALANQKYSEFGIYTKLGLSVARRVGRSRIRDEEYVQDMGDIDSDIVVATYEGIDHLFRRGEKIKAGVVVIDELQTLAQEERGIELDGFIARLRHRVKGARLIALSATLGNPEEIASHYSLKLVIYDKRPIPLERHLVMCRDEEEKRRAILELVRQESSVKSSKGYYGQSLIFTNSRRKASAIASYLRSSGIPAVDYHAGLSYAKRKSIEEDFINQKIKAVVATSALAAGVDFPASQVIFESLSMGNRELKVMDFLQMQGRAGRPAYHDRGKVVIVISPERGEDKLAFRLLKGEAEPVEIPAEQDEVDAQVLACAVAGDWRIAGDMLYPVELEQAVKRLEESGFLLNGKPTPLGRVTAEHFLLPGEALHMFNSDAPPVEILARLFPFENAYISKSLAKAIQRSYRISPPVKYLDAVGIIFQEPREEFADVLETVREEFLKCSCREFPYCQHAEVELSKKIIHLRLAGMKISRISKLLSTYYMEAFPGDLFNYLDSIIRKAEGLKEIFRLRGRDYRKVDEIIRKLEG